MEQKTIMEKYPIMTITFDKSEIKANSVDTIIEYLKQKIDTNPMANFIAVFDHLSHTKSINGEILQEIQDAKNLVFCFGTKIPNPQILALRPRGYGIVDMGEKIVISFLEAPMESMNNIMVEWVMSLKNK